MLSETHAGCRPGWVADRSPAVLGPGLAGEVGGGHRVISLQREPVSLSLITRQEAEAPHSPMGPAEADPKKLGGGRGRSSWPVFVPMSHHP